MNIFHLLGDFVHLMGFFFLLKKLHVRKNCNGISLKSQELFAVVFLTRYVNIFAPLSPWLPTIVVVYVRLMKLAYIGATCYIVYLMRTKLWKTYDDINDEAQRRLFLGAAGAMTLITVLVEQDWALLRILTIYSLWLEAIAIIPQFMLLQKRYVRGLMLIHRIAILL